MNYSNNPYQLQFVLSDNCTFCEHFTIFDIKHIDTFLGTLEMAVIGSSHYLKVGNSVCEILSGWLPQVSNSSVLCQKQVAGNFTVQHSFSGFEYAIAIQVQTLLPVNFKLAEASLMQQSMDLLVPFGNKTAITAIKILENGNNKLSLKTWHTYPEKDIVIETHCTLLKP